MKAKLVTEKLQHYRMSKLYNITSEADQQLLLKAMFNIYKNAIDNNLDEQDVNMFIKDIFTDLILPKFNKN
jgi:hypothetical protein